ncbi:MULTISPECIES: type II toxin-antitoxin system RelE/ParE family toxin [Caulobacter]|uniref:type II toxin-antitoxin system RelE/ParE family toxin n=1 Tax=Caulobacter TaxID=75 RepID=UPI00039F9141|nr:MULTISPECIES: type II toxin-antitoxin system RelE/ParE family toxin [Caulobacter]MBQ1561118.1 type II toxin-antitoxin system RelE/ParE family toxin [Caulobacter sp.]
MAEVVWTDRAFADIEAIVAYIASESKPLAAQRLGQKLLAVGESLRDHPDRGRPISHGRREVAFIKPYLMRYRIKGDRVFIMEVRHAARRRS